MALRNVLPAFPAKDKSGLGAPTITFGMRLRDPGMRAVKPEMSAFG